MSWSELIRTTRGKWAIAFCFVTLLIVIFYLPHFYGSVITPKPGLFLNDFFLNLFIPYNWSVIIFTIIYLSIVQTVISVYKKPGLILLGLTTYFGVTIIRMVTMYLWTLEPPLDMIFLTDPISTKFYPSGNFAKDMFFSGHVSTMMVLVLIERNRVARIAKIRGTMVIAFFLAWQHVHYTVDLVVAPIVTYGVFFTAKKLLEVPLND